jgi:cystathionine beta-lyase
LFARDFAGASGLFSFVLRDGDEASRAAFIDSLDLFGIGFSWGGFESLAVPADPVRSAAGRDVGGALVRLHIGLEDPADLIADLERGFAAFGEAV